MWSSISQSAGACRTLFPLAALVGMIAVASPQVATAQARGAVTVQAQVVSAAPGQAGIEGAAELLRSRRPALDSATRAETALAVVSLRWEVRGSPPDEGRVGEADRARPRLVASIEFLRN